MYDKILVPLDGSKLAECVLDHVIGLVKDGKAKEVVLFRVCEPVSVLADYPATMPDSWENHVRALNDVTNQQCGLYLEDVAARLKEAGVSNISLQSSLGDPATQVADFAKKNDIDLIIMASHGRSGPGRWAYGSTADKIFRSTCVPVLMVRAPGCIIGF